MIEYARAVRRGIVFGWRLGLSLVTVVLVAWAAVGPVVADASPGGRIAYHAFPSEVIWTSNLSGGERVRLAAGETPLVAPGGALVALIPRSAAETPFEGPALELLTTSGALSLQSGQAGVQELRPLAFSPDSRYLAVSIATFNSEGFAVPTGLGVLETGSGALTTIAKGDARGASFDPNGSDQLVFGDAPSQNENARTNLFTWTPGGAVRQITSDGRSLDPVWGPHYIAYAHERIRREWGPVMQIWLRTPSSRGRQFSHLPANELQGGVDPVAFSQSGSRLLGNFGGEDLDEAWVFDLPTGRARQVRVHRDTLVDPSGISADGSTVLVSASLGAGSPASVYTVPVAHGRPKLVVARASEASWSE